jgi:eukaryotic-like serine/threonine-protein kinase
MPVQPGSSLGNYDVLSAIGRGGMGEVWRARDKKLGREIAIKTLPEQFARDTERLARFEREARLLASLNHPNIASVYGLEEFSDTRFIVLELVEGETLAEILHRGPMATEDALKFALQIAMAIEAAHEKGVIHRDLKPANIKITPDGKVKVLDFGLAKAFESDPGNSSLSNSPTISMAATAKGIILGTAAYMSPEQARGTTVDSRTDIWAFGCVFYEMLTGRQAFRGEMVSDILASVLAREPDFTIFPAGIHPRVRELIQRCLEKDPKRRRQAIGDVRVEIERMLASGEVTAPADEGVANAPKATWRTLLPWTVAAAAVAAIAVWMLKPAPLPEPRPLVRFEYNLPPVPAQQFRSTGRPLLAFSRDGRHFAYNVNGGLFLRSMDSLAARLIPGTEGPLASPFFSPDGDWVAYLAPDAQSLRKIAIAGGAPVTICPASLPFGASWGKDGNILFAQPAGIMRVSSDGGMPELIVKTKENEQAEGPSLLPDGKTILYSLTRVRGASRWDQAEIVAQVPGSQPKVLVRGGSDARYVPTGHLVYAVGDVLFAVAFDLSRLEVKGGPVPIVTGVQRAIAPAQNTAAANYGISDRGALVYLNTVAAPNAVQTTLGMVDRNGAVRRLDVPPAIYRSPRVSPDGRQLAVETVSDTGQSIIWVYDLTGGKAIRRLTQEGNNTRPIWTRDGKKIAYGSDREKVYGIFLQPADGSGLPERLTSAEEGLQHYPESWSPDGRVLSLAVVRPPLGGNAWALWTLALDDTDKKPKLFYDSSNSNEFGSAFSPDGKWIAYASNEGPDVQFGIYVQPYPPTGVKYQISRSGGAWPIWAPNGSELLYRLSNTVNSTPKINAVTVTTKPVPAFTSEKELTIQGFVPVTNYREYDMMPNGKEFVMVFPVAQQTSAPAVAPSIHVILNWTEELKSRVQVK